LYGEASSLAFFERDRKAGGFCGVPDIYIYIYSLSLSLPPYLCPFPYFAHSPRSQTEPSFDKLPKQQQEILKLSSLLGVRFDTIILNEILPTSLKKKWDINAEINLLIDEGYLIEGSAPERQHMEGLWLHPRLAGNEFYCFLNDGVHQKVMAMTPSPDQKKKHRKIAQVYEEMYSEDLRPYLLPLAHHFGLGGHENKAFDYLKRAIYTALTALKTSELAVASDELSIRLLKRALVDLNGVELALQLARVVELDQVVKTCLREAGVPERTFASLQVSSGKKKRKKIKKKEEPLTDKEKVRTFPTLSSIDLPTFVFEYQKQVVFNLTGPSLCHIYT
jgi:hypothetical protein